MKRSIYLGLYFVMCWFVGGFLARCDDPPISAEQKLTGWVQAPVSKEERKQFQSYGALVQEGANKWIFADQNGVCSIFRFKSDVRSEWGIVLTYAHSHQEYPSTLLIPLNTQERPSGNLDVFKGACLQKIPDIPEDEIREDVLYYYHANIE